MRVSWRYRRRIRRGAWQLGVLSGGMRPSVVQPGLAASGQGASGPAFYSSIDGAPKKQGISGRPGSIRVARLCVLQDNDSIAVAWLIISIPILSGSRRQQRKILESRLRKILETERDGLLDAVTEAGLDPVWEVLTGSWRTLDPGNFEALEEAIISCQEELHQYLLGDPAGFAGAALGLPHMALLEAIADRIPIPGIDRSISELKQYAEIAGIILAVLAGGHILACASFKLLIHDELGELLAKLLDKFLRSFGAKPAERSSPAQRENSGRWPPIDPDQPPRPRPPQDQASGPEGPDEPPGSGRPGRNPPTGPGSQVFSPALPWPPRRLHPASANGSPPSRSRANRPPGSAQPDKDQHARRPARAEVQPGRSDLPSASASRRPRAGTVRRLPPQAVAVPPSPQLRPGRPPGSDLPDKNQVTGPSSPAAVVPGAPARPASRQGQPAPPRPRSGTVRPRIPRAAIVPPSPQPRSGRLPEAPGRQGRGRITGLSSPAAVGSGTPAQPASRQGPQPRPGRTDRVRHLAVPATGGSSSSRRRASRAPGSDLPDKDQVTGPPTPAHGRRIRASQVNPEETSSPRLTTPSRMYETQPPRAEPPSPPPPPIATPPSPAREIPVSRPAPRTHGGGRGR